MTDLVKRTLTAGVPAYFSSGLFFRIVSAPTPVDVMIRRRGSVGNAGGNNLPAGYSFGPVPETRRFDSVEVTSSVAQDIQVLVGDDLADVADINVALEAGVNAGAEHADMRWWNLTAAGDQVMPEVIGSDKVVRGVLVKAPSTNTVTIYFKMEEMFAAFEGFPMEPGETQWFPLGHDREILGGDNLHAWNTAANQDLGFAFFYDTP